MQVTETEVDDAADFLHEHGYIQAFQVAESNEHFRPRILPKGRAALRSDALLGNYDILGSATVNNDYSSSVIFGNQAQVAGFQSGGHDSIQVIRQTITRKSGLIWLIASPN